MTQQQDNTSLKDKSRKLSKKEVVAKFLEQLTAHDSHDKKQIGPCVYCVTCNERLYQGKL